MDSIDIKRTKIIESAKLRFSHFGMAKTTMAEIAKDLSFSKALLYYYFPDKNSLYVAVWDSIVEEMMARLDIVVAKGGPIEDLFMIVLEERMKCVKEHYNIFIHMYTFRLEMPPQLEKYIPEMYEKEVRQFERLLNVGLENKEIYLEDSYEIARILLVSLLGVRVGLLREYKSLFIPPTKEEVDQILNMQKKLGKIFIDGLRKP